MITYWCFNKWKQ